ncbi:MAG: hypothetical protein M0Z60_01230 [Nitrospiraceae bacterium]|nr:hypothetical protein [Nitrospiraceae bacterium]
MLVGYNTNVPYKGKLYHVQTEDNGRKNPLVVTLLYIKGTILASKKTSYAHLVEDPDWKEKVRELMKEQHKAMMKELIRGAHTGDAAGIAEEVPAEPQVTAVPQAAAPAPAAPEEPQPEAAPDAKQQISKSLDDVLLDYIIRGGK